MPPRIPPRFSFSIDFNIKCECTIKVKDTKEWMGVCLSLFTITTKSHWMYAIHHPCYILNLMLCINTIHVYYGPTRFQNLTPVTKEPLPNSSTRPTRLKETNQEDKFEVAAKLRFSSRMLAISVVMVLN